jgi:uncharacterized alpha-E superfamily protein
MLSRVAERLYWMARYLERAENTARLARVYSYLMLDLPNGVGLSWQQLIDITGNQELYRKRHRTSGERNVMRFILSEPENPGSLISALSMARENMRTTRDLVPSEGWEHVNELYLFAKKKLAKKTLPKGLYDFLSEIIMRCQQITGLLAGTMSHGDAYQFMRIGRNLERFDMTSRIIDVGSATLLARGAELERLEGRLWTYLLRALSAHQMYRQYVRRHIRPDIVLGFLLHDVHFPRAMAHTLGEIQSCLTLLPRNEETLQSISELSRQVLASDVGTLYPQGLHAFLDKLQLELGGLHQEIVRTWFAPVSDQPA